MNESELATMSIDNLREFNYNPTLFHKVKHTRAFAILIERLAKVEKQLNQEPRFRLIHNVHGKGFPDEIFTVKEIADGDLLFSGSPYKDFQDGITFITVVEK